jgi:hypothetical protein
MKNTWLLIWHLWWYCAATIVRKPGSELGCWLG